MKPVRDAPEKHKVKAPVGASTGKSSRPKAAGVPDPPRHKKVQALAVTEALNPQALPESAQKAGEVLARARTTYRSSEPTREQVFWENDGSREKQLTEGYLYPPGKPYRELEEILDLEPKIAIPYSLRHLTQELVEDDVQEKPPKEVAEVTTSEEPSSKEPDPPEPSKKQFQARETGKELRTPSKALAHSRQHLNPVKKGGQYFHTLHQESLQRKTTVGAVKQAQATSWAVTEGSLLRDSGKKEKKITLWSFAPVYVSVLITNPPGAKSEHLFRQLCAMHWLLKAMTLKPNNQMCFLLTCWDPINPGGHQKTVREIEEEKLAAQMEKFLFSDEETNIPEIPYGLFRTKMTGASAPSTSQHSPQSSLCGQTSRDSITSSVLSSKDSIKISVSSSDEEAEEQFSPRSLQKVIQKTHEEASKDVHKQEVMHKKTGLKHLLPESQKIQRLKLPLIKDQESTTARNQSPRRQGGQEERSYKTCHALKHVKYFRRDIERIRQLDKETRTEDDEKGLHWFPILLARLPESVKSDHFIQKILKKLEKFGRNPDLKIPPDTFLKVLGGLEVWQLCSPEIAAAVEFVRENIVQMPEEDFSEWLQTRLVPVFASSSTF